MFESLGRIITRTWPILLLGWAALFAGLAWTAPEWDEVAREGSFAFLPEYVPTQEGEALYRRAFPGEPLGSSIVLVVHPESGPAALRSADRQWIRQTLVPPLRELAGDLPAVEDVRAPSGEMTGRLLLNERETAALVVIELTTEFLSERNIALVARVEELLGEIRGDGRVPAGVEVTLAGSAVLGRDYIRAQSESVDATEFWTVVLVTLLLVLVYRAPLLALIPLATVYVSVEVSLSALSYLARADFVGLFQGLEVYITVICYAAGVDYSLFMISRCREEADQGADLPQAVARSVGSVGEAISASAATSIFGIGMMAFAEFGKFQQAGIGIAAGLFVTLCAILTLSMPLLRLAGRWAFWPDQPGQGEANRRNWLGRLTGGSRFHRFWDRLGELLLRRPGRVWLVTAGLMVPFVGVAGWFYSRLSYGIADELRQTAPSIRGIDVLQRYFPAGRTGSTTLLLRNPQVDFSSPGGMQHVETLTQRLWQRREDLQLAEIRSVSAPLGVGTDPVPAEAADGPLAARLVQRAAARRRAASYYVSQGERLDGHVTRIILLYRVDPFSREALRLLAETERAVRAALPEAIRANTQTSFIGATASLRDLRTVARRDRTRIKLLVTTAVFLILVVLLRTISISLYLILSVLFGYFTTVGVTFAVFWALDPQGFAGLDWTVPLFLFTVLVAVGEDYNIFLISRVNEEQERHGPVHGITTALTRTGPIISGCGVIMAGTFSSLLVGGKLAGMQQLGFALAFGILLDTFVVRPVLVPAYLLLVNSGRFGRLGRYLGAREAK